MREQAQTSKDFNSPINLPLSNSSFSALRHANKIYVDKTEFVYELSRNPTAKYFLARPRRFGKSLLISTFESLFKKGTADFKGLYIEDKWTDTNKYYVLKLDFSTINQFDNESAFEDLLNKHLSLRIKKCESDYGRINDINCVVYFEEWLTTREENSVVLLIDEYDAPLTACLDRPELFIKVRNILYAFYSKIKSLDEVFRFVFITGITKFNKTSIFTSLNNFNDLTLSPNFGTILGFTSKEVEEYFKTYLEVARQTLSLSYSELLSELENQYDGFCFEETCKQKVFAPWSVLKFLDAPIRGFKNYWIESGGYATALQKYLKSHALRHPNYYFKAKYISYEHLNSPTPDLFHLNDLILLVQSGYLTLKSINNDDFEVGYPNKEVAVSLALIYKSKLLAGKTLGDLGVSSLQSCLQNGEPLQVIQMLNKILLHLDYQKYPITDELTCRNYIQLILTLQGNNRTFAELHNASGRSDIEVDTPDIRWVFEIKFVRISMESDSFVRRKIEEGIKQILSKHYGEQDLESKTLIRICLVYSESSRQIVAWEAV